MSSFVCQRGFGTLNGRSVFPGDEIEISCCDPLNSPPSPTHTAEITHRGQPTWVDSITEQDLFTRCSRAQTQMIQYPPPPPQPTNALAPLIPPATQSAIAAKLAAAAARGPGKVNVAWDDPVPVILAPPEVYRSCECGADSIGSPGHSGWCPKA